MDQLLPLSGEQRVFVNGCGSDWSLMCYVWRTSGTVLGPTLFNLFINDIVDVASPGSEIRHFWLMTAFAFGKFAVGKTARPYSRRSTGSLSVLTPG